MPTTRNQALSCILGGLLLVAIQLFLISLDHRLDEGLLRMETPALLPDLHRQAFGCLVAFLMGWGFFLLPGPVGSERILTFAAIRSLAVGLITAVLCFQLSCFLSRLPSLSGAPPRSWTEHVPVAVGMSVLAAWFSFFAFAQHAYDAKDEAALRAITRRR